MNSRKLQKQKERQEKENQQNQRDLDETAFNHS